MNKRPVVWQCIAMFVAGATLLSGCGEQAEQAQASGAAAPTVKVVTVQAKPLVLSSELPGRIEPVRVAEVRARVPGIVLKRYFAEGADVKAGQLLLQIDPAPLRAALARAEGEQARADAALFEAQALVRRYTPLVEIEAVSRQDFDKARAALKSAQAALASARADVQTAQLNLGYATVKAPISGRIGRALVSEGALVGQGEATVLAVIQQIDPVYADFKQPVADMLRARAALADGQAEQGDQAAAISLTVEGTEYQREGRLLFSDVTVERSTGQVSLRGQFANADGVLLPGMYVRVHSHQGTYPQAILVPQRAVQRSADGRAQVLIVAADDTVHIRQVSTGTMHGADWHITEGLQEGDRVIVGGRASPGSKVTVAATDSNAAPSAANSPSNVRN